MSLEELCSNFKKIFKKTITILSLSAFLYSCHPPVPTPEPKPETLYDYTTTTKIVASKNINTNGGSLQVTDSDSFVYNSKITIPSGALDSNKFISIAEVNNPPALPDGLGYVGAPVGLEPNGTNFNFPTTVTIPYNDEFLSDAGISDDSNLKLYSYNTSSKNWTKIDNFSLDTVNNTITANINHFSYYAITCLNGILPEDLGNPQSGDLLYSLGAFWDGGNLKLKDNWMPGHVGIYTGEKKYSGGLASDDVKKFGMYNVIEACGRGVQFSYYDIPNVIEKFENSLNSFGGANVYMGAREPKDVTLTQQQREEIVAFAEAQIGKPYAWAQTAGVFFGMLRGSLVKGDFGSFNCVGLAEKAYEEAGVNGGEGLVTLWQEEVGAFNLPPALTPAEQYNTTKSAVGLFNIKDRGPANGWIFYDKGIYSDGWRYLEAAPVDQTPRIWGTSNHTVTGADGTAIGTGKQNTLDIIEGDTAENKAADECANYSIINGGVTYNDWFLPSKGELNVMYNNLKASGVGGFVDKDYWSSSEDGTKYAWYHYFLNGLQFYGFKNNSRQVRAVRAF